IELLQRLWPFQVAQLQPVLGVGDGGLARLTAHQHAGPAVVAADAADREVGRPAEEVGALVAALQGSAVEVPDRFGDQRLALVVLDDQLAPDHVDAADVRQRDAALALDLVDHELLVVEALGAQQGDRQDDRLRPGRSPRPRACLHRLEPFDLAGRPFQGDPRVGREVELAEVEVGEGHRLVVEAAGALDHLGRGARQEGLALPALGGALAGQQHPVELAGFEQRDQDGADYAAVLRAGQVRPGPGAVALAHRLPVARRGGELPGRLVAQAAGWAVVPAQRAAGAHLDERGQAVVAGADRVARADGHAGAALDAAIRGDHRLVEVPEPDLPRRLVDVVHLVAYLDPRHQPSSPGDRGSTADCPAAGPAAALSAARSCGPGCAPLLEPPGPPVNRGATASLLEPPGPPVNRGATASLL